jgi:hypothetical protein
MYINCPCVSVAETGPNREGDLSGYILSHYGTISAHVQHGQGLLRRTY